MDLEKCRKKKKRIIFSLPFLVFGPFPSAGPSPPRSPAQPPPPCALRGPASAPAQPRSSPAFCGHPATVRRPFLLTDRPGPPVGAVSFPARLGNRPRPAPEQPPPTHCASWERFPPLLGLDKEEPSPPRVPCCFPEPFSLAFAPRKPRNRALRISAGHRPRHPRRRLLRASPSSFFPAVRIPSLSSFSPALFFGVRWVLAP